MLSTSYRLRLNTICQSIETGCPVSLTDMIWADKLAHSNRTAAAMLRQARRRAITPDMASEGLDSFLNDLDLGDPDPSNHRTGFDSPEDIANWFSRTDNERGEEWRRRD